MTQIINSNLDSFHCVLLKMVSGEEVIAHVNKKSLNSRKDSLILYDPYQIVMNKGMIVLTAWVIACDQFEYVISKQDIMIRTIPNPEFVEFYDNFINKKYEDIIKKSINDDNNLLETYENKIIVEGSDTIN